LLLSLALLLSQVNAAPLPVQKNDTRIAPELLAARSLKPSAQAQWLSRQRGRVSPSRLKVHLELELEAFLFLERYPRFERELTVQVHMDKAIQVAVRLDQLEWIADHVEIRSLRRPVFARSKETTSEGVESLFVGELWQQEGLTGAGVRVAVVDIGFEGYQTLVGTELPVVDTSGLVGEWDTDDHGTAVAEIIHDIAPDAAISLFNFETELEFRALLMEFAQGQHDVDIINASIGFDNVWHADGTSPYSVGVDAVVESGLVYVAAAGNEAESYRWGTLTDVDNNGWLEIDGVEGTLVSTSSVYGTKWAEVSLRWMDPMQGSDNDLDLVITEEDDTLECGRSENTQNGDDTPFEYVSCESQGDWAVAWIRAKSEADYSGKRAWIYSYGSVDPDLFVQSETLTLPADANGALTVGAYRQSTDKIAWYSSRGPTQDGRIKPDIVGPTGVTTSSMGYKTADGTSFAAPHLTGLAALVLEHRPRYSPQEVKDFLMEETRDLGATGADSTFGAGAVALESLPKGCGCTTSRKQPVAWVWMFGLVALVRGRRE
jgi:MYXO-CTERM domain-containing protein